MFPIVHVLGSLAAGIVWGGLVVFRLSQLRRSEFRSERLLFGIVATSCVFVGIALLVYFLSPFFAWSLAIVFVLATLLIAFWPISQEPVSLIRRDSRRIPWLVIGVLVVTQACLFVLMCAGRTSEPLVSPWLLFPDSIFILFCLSTLLSGYVSTKLGARGLPFASVQMLLAVALAAIVYGIGFGFDPFIHRAAEQALITTGSIEPVSVLYSGQYALVGFLHYLTALPIHWIDVWLLPLAVSMLLPLVTYVGLRFGWGIREEVASLGWLSVLFVPFMLLTFTVPFSITYAVFIAGLFLFPLTREKSWWWLLSIVGVLMIFFHPLLGVPTFCLIFFSGFIYRSRTSEQRRLALTALGGAVCLGVPLLLIVYQSQAETEIVLRKLLTNVGAFISLFINPFNNYHPSIRWEYHALYAWRYWQPILLSVVLWPFALFVVARQRSQVLILFAFALGLAGCMYIVSTLFTFAGIIQHEQQEFALRLLQSWYLIPLPFVMLAVDTLYDVVWKRQATLFILALGATAAWYFSYPQYNAKFAYYSPSVSKYDLQTVKLIDHDAAARPYIVLSNQMTSAAALQVFGFAHYHSLQDEEILWYAIPTGGKLYDYYLKIIYGNDPVLLQELMHDTDTESVYVVMPTYWSWNQDILDHLEVQSAQTFFVEDKILIYRFDFYGDTNQDANKDAGTNHD